MDAPNSPPRPTQLAHTLLREVIRPGDTVVDATAGNGHDTQFLADCVGENGRVLAFDVQQQAIDSSRQRLAGAQLLDRVGFHRLSHALMHEHVAPGSVSAVMFNLGYLPGGGHDYTTEAGETIQALESAALILKSGGILTVVCYPGHASGAEEARAVETWMTALPETGWKVARYGMIGTRSPAPCLFVASKP